MTTQNDSNEQMIAEYEFWADRAYWASEMGMRWIEIESFRALALAALWQVK